MGYNEREVHTLLVERYRAKAVKGAWHTLVDDGYIYNHLTWHLEKAGQSDSLSTLLTEETKGSANGWYTARIRKGQTAGYLNDVDRAWKHAINLSQISIQKGELAAGLAGEARFALYKACINSLALEIPPALIAGLVQTGIWTLEQALDLARQNPARWDQVRELQAICRVLPDSQRNDVLQEVLQFVFAWDNETYRNMALLKILPDLPEELKKIATEKLLISAHSADGQIDIRLIAKILIFLPSEQFNKERDEAVNVVPKMMDNEYSMGNAYKELAADLTLDQLRMVVKTVQSFKYEEVIKAQTLSILAPRFAALGRFEEAQKIAENIWWGWYRDAAIVEIISYMPSDHWDASLEEIGKLKNISSSRVGDNKAAPAFEQMSLGLANLGKVDLAVQVVQSYDFATKRAEILNKLICRLADLGHTQQALDLISDLPESKSIESLAALVCAFARKADIPQALRIAENISEKFWREQSIAEVAQYLPDLERESLLRERLVTAQGIGDEQSSQYAYGALIPLLAGLGELEYAWQEIEQLSDPHEQELVRIDCIPRLPEAARTVWLNHVLECIGDLPTEKWKDNLSKILPYLSLIQLNELVQYVRSSLSEDHLWEALEILAPTLAIAGNLQQAHSLVAVPPSLYWQARIEVAVLPFEPEAERWNIAYQCLIEKQVESESLDQYIDITLLYLPYLEKSYKDFELLLIPHRVRELSNPVFQLELWGKIAPFLDEELLNEALLFVIGSGEEIDYYQAEALAKLAPRLAELGKPEEALGLTHKMGIYLQYKVEAWVRIAELSSQEIRQQILNLASGFSGFGKDYDLLTAFVGLVPLLNEPFQSEALNKIVHYWNKEPSWHYKVYPLGKLMGDRLGKSFFKQLFETARVIGEGYYRDLEAFAPYLVTLPREFTFQLWQDTLTILARRSRGDMLREIGALAPVIAALAGVKGVVETIRAIHDVTKWWP